MDTDKVTESVSWAKFGPESLRAFSWNLVKEEVRQPQTLPKRNNITNPPPPNPDREGRGRGGQGRREAAQGGVRRVNSA
jgi:hypothetical protein